ncbi:MAG TPA: ATP-binding protein, partial [Pseudomonadota bacterium]|nr:ATP-binding protein [Pseudomonadota bacterium]
MAPKLPRLLVSHLGPIQSADITFGDLTVLVGPQASGKSILFQTLKLALDGKAISSTLALRGIGWGEKEAFTELFYGEGMSSLRNRNTRISWQGRAVSLAREYPVEKAGSQAPVPSSVYYIPAHRVMAIKNGWPRHFSDYSPDDPYVLREFSEKLRGFVELFWQRGDKAIFPPRGELATGTRKLLQEQLFGNYQLTQEVRGAQKRLVLKRGSEAPLPYIAWSTGQREFGPLLLGCLSVLLPARL